MAEKKTQQSGTIGVERNDTDGFVTVYADVDGVRVPLTVVKAGFYDKLKQQADDQAEQQKSSTSES